MTQDPPPRDEGASLRAAALFAEALTEMVRSLSERSGLSDARNEVHSARLAIEGLAERVDRRLAEDGEQRRLLGDQLTSLAGSLDRLVSHLQGLSTLMAELLERLATPGPGKEPEPEPLFLPGGEGVTVVLAGVPGFQTLMDVQKGLAAAEPIDGASVESYREGDSRILLHLRSPVTATFILDALRTATDLNAVIEESRPETHRLKIKIVASA